MIRDHAVEDVLGAWGIRLGRIRGDIPIAGSPDRCEFRTVVEDVGANLFVLENVRPADIPHKRKIARALAFLAGNGLSLVRPFLSAGSDEYLAFRDNTAWLLSPYVQGVPLQRPEYAFEGWRGPVLADFLIELRERSREVPEYERSTPFSIVAFIRDFARIVERRETLLYPRLRPALAHLEEGFMTVHDRLPVRFSHGDYHPLNVVWSESGIRAVIDWEFLGLKPELYDAAMMIGCLGMEDPPCLTQNLVFEFVKRLKEAHPAAETSWAYLFDLVLALRFAWLSDWLKRSDGEMIELETVYIELLLRSRLTLIRSWET
jgi:homoserine kinase type II